MDCEIRKVMIKKAEIYYFCLFIVFKILFTDSFHDICRCSFLHHAKQGTEEVSPLFRTDGEVSRFRSFLSVGQ
ncbi:hypothetical protein INE88_02620 [Bacteroides eggerthii]|uniref:Uncharacterized protein n=1 Tax=Bacteroides eggerthii TaxID=28111 RepID=A0A975KHS6_9BACE|nr:hypothetical protein INE88_02620 [Bacteroides eggerthii]